MICWTFVSCVQHLYKLENFLEYSIKGEYMYSPFSSYFPYTLSIAFPLSKKCVAAQLTSSNTHIPAQKHGY